MLRDFLRVLFYQWPAGGPGEEKQLHTLICDNHEIARHRVRIPANWTALR